MRTDTPGHSYSSDAHVYHQKYLQCLSRANWSMKLSRRHTYISQYNKIYSRLDIAIDEGWNPNHRTYNQANQSCASKLYSHIDADR